MPPDSLRLLGAFHLIHRGEEIRLTQARLQELIAQVAVCLGLPVTRGQIANHFWPDSSDKQARANVRILLHRLRKAWPRAEELIVIERTHITWRRDAAALVDVHRFEELLAQTKQSQNAHERTHLLSDAADVYRGDLLPDCYAEWALAAREQLRSRYAAMLETLIDDLVELRRYDDALHRAKQLRDHDPLHESSYRRLMQISMLLGDRTAALRVFHACASILEKELGVEPAPATLEIHAQLLQHGPGAALDQAVPQPVQRPHMIGRHEEWSQLRQTWHDVQQGRAHCVVIWGDAGIGKTRLAEELIDVVSRHGQAWASSRSYAAEGALSYAPITEWLRSSQVQAHIDAVDDLWRVELARLLPELLAARTDLPYPGPLTETWQQQRFFQGVVHAFQAVPGPLLLHLDDMQWSDQETLTMLRFLLHGTPSLLIVGAVRTEDAVDNPALASLLEALRHSSQLTEIRLTPLSQMEVAELAEQTAGAPIESALAATLYETSEGHPLFLIETVRGGLTEAASLGANRPFVAIPSERRVVSGIPPKIYTLISARLKQLSSAAQQVASTAAVIGRAFTYQVLQTAISMDELTLVDALDELWTRRLVREQSGDGYDFSHDRIREVAYQEISRARRRLLHRQVAEALETIHGHDPDNVAGELAAHYAQAGDTERAYRFYRRAAKVAVAQHALTHAEAMFDAALASVPNDPAARTELLQEQSAVFHYSLQLAAWRKNLDEQQILLDALNGSLPELQLAYYLDLTQFFITVGEGGKAEDVAQKAVELAQTLDATVALARSHHRLASAYWLQTCMADASRHFERSGHYARQIGDRAVEASSMELQAQTGMFTGMPANQIYDLLRRAYAIAEATGDRRLMTALFNKFAYLRVAQGMGDLDRAEEDYRRGLALSREIGDRTREELILSNLGVLYTRKGDYRKAWEALKASIQIRQGEVNDWRYRVTQHYLGALLMQMGRLDDARATLLEASEELNRFGNRHFEVKVRCDLGLLYHLDNDHESAQEELTHVLGLIADHGDLRFEALVSVRLGYALEVAGRWDNAASMYARGFDLHQQMGQQYYALNGLAGSARVADLQGDQTTAYAHVRTIWGVIAGKEMDATVESVRTLRTCYTIFRKLKDAQAADVLDTACGQLMRRAGTIDDPQHLAQFRQLDDHRFFTDIHTTARQS